MTRIWLRNCGCGLLQYVLTLLCVFSHTAGARDACSRFGVSLPAHTKTTDVSWPSLFARFYALKLFFIACVDDIPLLCLRSRGAAPTAKCAVAFDANGCGARGSTTVQTMFLHFMFLFSHWVDRKSCIQVPLPCATRFESRLRDLSYCAVKSHAQCSDIV